MSVLNIKTVYLRHGHKPKIVRSKDANRAVSQCARHMMVNHYGSHLAEVFDEETGELHAQIKLKKNGNLEIIFQRDPAKFETRWALSYVLGH